MVKRCYAALNPFELPVKLATTMWFFVELLNRLDLEA